MSNTAEHHMPDSPESDLLSACQIEIERAWNDARDDAPVHRLALAHPELAEELYDFFVCVIEADDELDRPRPEFAEMDWKVRELLDRTRQVAQPKRPKPFLALVRDATGGEFVDVIAESMGVAVDFLIDATDHGTVLPLAARRELLRRVGGVRLERGIDEGEAIAAFDVPVTLRRVASRSGAYRPVDVTYREIVERSSMSDEEKRHWLGFA